MSICCKAMIVVGVIGTAILAGCGSSSSSNDVRPHVQALAGTIAQYNDSVGTDLATTGKACEQALGRLEGDNLAHVLASVPSKQLQAAADLRRAARLAETAFRHCGTAASTLNYPLMVQAEREIAEANVAVNAARSAAGS